MVCNLFIVCGRHAALGELKAFLLKHRPFMSGLVAEVVACQGSHSFANKRVQELHGLLSNLMAALLACCDNTLRTRLGESRKCK